MDIICKDSNICDNCIGLHPILSDCKVRKCAEFGWICARCPDRHSTFGRDLERSDKSPFDKGGFRVNVNT
jgi:hypothetical protein